MGAKTKSATDGKSKKGHGGKVRSSTSASATQQKSKDPASKTATKASAATRKQKNNADPEKAPNPAAPGAIKSKSALYPTPTVEEADFPRGGGTSLSAIEVAEARREGAREAETLIREPQEDGFGTLSDGNRTARKKRKLADRKERRAGVPGAGKDGGKDKAAEGRHIEGALRVDHLNYKRLVPGTKVAGLIVAVRPLELIVSLPNQLAGHVPITHVSQRYTQRLQEAAELEDDSGESDDENQSEVSNGGGEKPGSVKSLDQLFKVGQWVRCAVSSAGTTSRLPSGRTSALLNSAARVTLTLDPAEVNATISVADISSGLCLSAVVKSREDRGWILDLGISAAKQTKKASSNIEAFVSFADVKKAQAAEWDVGAVVDVKVVKLAENRRTCTISLVPEELQSALLPSASSVGSLLPLHLVSALVTAVIPGAGLNVKLSGFYDGTIDLFHLPLLHGERVEDKYSVGQKIRARLLWDSIMPASDMKKFALSALPHVVDLSPSAAEGIGAGEEPAGFPIGYTFEAVKVQRVDPEWGLSVICTAREDGQALENSEGAGSLPLRGFVHISHVSDTHLPSLSTNSGSFRPGTTHRARVLGSYAFDGLVSLSLAQSTLSQRFLHVRDLKVGEIVEGSVRRLAEDKRAVWVDIGGHLDAVCWSLHFSDVLLKHPEKRFKPGGKVKARVFSINEEKGRISLTLKKSLVESELQFPTSFDDMHVGMVIQGVLTKIMEKSMLVDFFGGVRGLIPISEAAEAYTEALSSRFRLGQVVKVKVTRVDTAERKVVASIRQALGDDPAQEGEASYANTEIGAAVSGIITDVHSTNAVLRLEPGGATGLISLTVLAKRRGVDLTDLAPTLKRGDKIPDLIVTKKNEERKITIVGYKKPDIDKTPCSSLNTIISLDSLVEGQIFMCKLVSFVAGGAVAQISRNLKGRIAWTDLSDDYDRLPERGTFVKCAIVGLDVELGRIDLAARPSVVAANPNSAGTVKDRRVESVADLKEGGAVRGAVRNIADSGLFVALGRHVTARVQIKDLFDDYVKEWKSRFSVGQIVSGTIIKVESSTAKVDMSLRTRPKVAPGVTTIALEDIAADQVVDAVVKRIEAYGAFLRIKDSSISGLCHKSQVVDDPETENWKERIKEGEQVKALVIAVDLEKRKIGFSLKPTRLSALGVEAKTQHESQEEVETGRNDTGSEVSEELDVDIGGMVDDDEDGPGGEDEEAVETGSTDVEDHHENGVGASAASAAMLSLPGGFSWDGTAAAPEGDASEPDSDESHSSDEADDSARVATRAVKRRKIEAAEPVSVGEPEAPKTADEFERLLLGSPNSSYLWIRLMSFYLETSNVTAARATARRALDRGISFREDTERHNVWVALLNLENTYGDDKSLEKVFSEACGACEAKHIWLKLAEIYEQTGKFGKAEELYGRLVKKFSQSSKAWTSAGAYALARDQPDQARELLQRSMKSLAKRKHVKTVSRFAQLEFKQGDPERARTLFEGLVASFPKRTDLWNVYIDMEVTRGGAVPERPRALFERMLDLGLNTKRAKFVFKKWLAFEQVHGDEAGEEYVKLKARQYVESLAAPIEPDDENAGGD